jgi:hypothetical protein
MVYWSFRNKSHKLTPFQFYLKPPVIQPFYFLNIDSKNNVIIFANNKHLTRQVCLEIMEGAWFKSLLGQWLSWQMFLDFTQTLQENAYIGPQLGHDHSLPNKIQHLSIIIPSDTVQSQYWKCIINEPTEEHASWAVWHRLEGDGEECNCRQKGVSFKCSHTQYPWQFFLQPLYNIMQEIFILQRKITKFS